MTLGLIINLLLVPALLVGLGMLLRSTAQKIVPTSLLRFWIYPGTAIHELSHTIACIAVFAPVHQVVLFRLDGSGEVRHGPSKLGKLGDMLIAIAPVGGGLVALWLLNLLLGNPLHWGGIVTGDGAESLMFIPALFVLCGKGLMNSLQIADFTSWKLWLMVYLSVSIAMTMMPSAQDFKNAAIGILIVVVAVIAWVLISHWLGATSSGAVGAFLTMVLGYGYVVLYCYALGFGIMLILYLLGRLFGMFRGSKSA